MSGLAEAVVKSGYSLFKGLQMSSICLMTSLHSINLCDQDQSGWLVECPSPRTSLKGKVKAKSSRVQSRDVATSGVNSFCLSSGRVLPFTHCLPWLETSRATPFIWG